MSDRKRQKPIDRLESGKRAKLGQQVTSSKSLYDFFKVSGVATATPSSAPATSASSSASSLAVTASATSTSVSASSTGVIATSSVAAADSSATSTPLTASSTGVIATSFVATADSSATSTPLSASSTGVIATSSVAAADSSATPTPLSASSIDAITTSTAAADTSATSTPLSASSTGVIATSFAAAADSSFTSTSLSASIGAVKTATSVPRKTGIRFEPIQTNCGSFPKDADGRCFLASWYKMFEWLEWNNDLNAALCHPCSALRENNISTSSKAEDSFSLVGFQRWKKAVECFRKHEQSQAHRSAVFKFTAIKGKENIAAKIEDCHGIEMKQNTKYLMAIFTCTRFLAKQGLAIRGHGDVGSNFLELLKLRSADIPGLSGWLDRKTAWCSHDIQNEILRTMSHELQRQLSTKIRDSRYHAVMADETTDKSGQTQMAVGFRIVDENMDSDEIILGMYSLPRTDAATIYTVINDICIRYQIPSTHCKAACFDGATTFQGEISGVKSRILDDNPEVIVSHCLMHSVNLAVQETVSEVPILRDFLVLVADLIKFLRGSPKRHNIVKLVAEEQNCLQRHVRPMCPTRFTVKNKALTGIQNQLEVIVESLSSIVDDCNDRSIKAHASGFLDRMSKFDFYFCLEVCLLIFGVTDILSTNLQHKSLSLGTGLELVRFSKRSLESFRTDTKFNEVWSKCTATSEKMEADPPIIPRNVSVRAPRRLQASTPHQFTTPAQKYKVDYYSALDFAVGCLDKRLTDKAPIFLSAAENVLVNSWYDKVISQNDIDLIAEQYGRDLDVDCLKSQLTIVKNMVPEKEETLTASQVIAAIGRHKSNRMIPEVVKLCQLYNTNPATTATAERSFSRLRRLKNYLRSTMSQDRLNHSLLLNMYDDFVDHLDMSKLVNTFILSGDNKRRNAFALL